MINVLHAKTLPIVEVVIFELQAKFGQLYTLFETSIAFKLFFKAEAFVKAEATSKQSPQYEWI